MWLILQSVFILKFLSHHHLYCYLMMYGSLVAEMFLFIPLLQKRPDRLTCGQYLVSITWKHYISCLPIDLITQHPRLLCQQCVHKNLIWRVLWSWLNSVKCSLASACGLFSLRVSVPDGGACKSRGEQIQSHTYNTWPASPSEQM